jgi:hypothetical protein
MPRTTLNTWLNAVETKTGPTLPDLRHLCLALARFMSGDGAAGCFPGTRAIAERLGVHRATAARWLTRLSDEGWIERVPRKAQYGRISFSYFPALPMAHDAAPITRANGAPERAYHTNGASGATGIGAQAPIIGARKSGIGAPGRDGSYPESLTEKSAASPSPRAADSAALDQEEEFLRQLQRARAGLKPKSLDELRVDVQNLRAHGYTDARIMQIAKDMGRDPDQRRGVAA